MGNCAGKPKKDPKANNPNNQLRVRGSVREQKLEAKIVLIGNSGVGKTSIALRYKEGKFNDNPKATVGASYFMKDVGFRDGSMLRLHIWDTGGAEKFKTVAPLYYRGAHAALVVYSVMDENSFRSMDDWLKQLDDHNDIEKMLKFVIGNKSDVEKSERRVEFKQGQAYKEQRGLEFFETSAVLNDGSITNVFDKLAAMIKLTFTEKELTATV